MEELQLAASNGEPSLKQEDGALSHKVVLEVSGVLSLKVEPEVNGVSLKAVLPKVKPEEHFEQVLAALD